MQPIIDAFRSRRFDEAREHFERLDEAQRHHPLVLEIAANLYAQLGRPDDELAQWHALHRIRRHDPRICRSLASALLDQHRFDDAARILERFLTMGHADIEVGALLVQTQLRQRRYEAAIAQAQGLRENASPGAQAALTALEARARFFLDQGVEARALLTSLDAAPPSDAGACREIAESWRTMRDLPMAIAWFERTTRLAPDHLETWEALASCHEQARNKDTARKIAQTVLTKLGPSQGMERLLVRLDHQEGHILQARTRAEALLQRPMPLEDRRSLNLELAKLAQRQGDWSTAYDKAIQGNRLAQTEFARQGYHRGALTATVAHLRACATAPGPEVPTRDSGHRPPTFVVGVPRSGTTLVQQMLQAHPAIETLDETDPASRVLRRYWAGRPDTPVAPFPEQLHQIETDEWPALRQAYWDAVAEDGVTLTNTTHLVDKLPLSLVRLPWLRALFPDALVVLCLRDPRDIVWSNFLQDYAPNSFSAETTSLTSTASFVAETLRLWLAWRDEPPLRTLVLRYESTVADPEAAMRRVLDAMDLPFNPAVTRPHELVPRPIRTPSYLDVNQPIHQGASERWRQLLPFLNPVRTVLEPVVTALGYPPTPDPAPMR
ncbi:MAG: sulfotransferase [Myxococcota bacterium]